MDDDNTLDLFTEPPPPEGDFLTLGNYAERAYLDYAVSVVRAARCRMCATARSRCNAASCSQ